MKWRGEKKIKNHTILTKYELKKALGLTTEIKPRSKSYIFSKSPEESFEFATRKDAVDGMNVSSTKLARGIKDGKILIENIEYKFEKFQNFIFSKFYFFIFPIKMDKNLPELRAEAKRLGLKRFSRLKKADLINLIARNSSPILDEEIPEIDSEILKPTKYIKPRIDEDEVKRKKEIRELEEMLGLRRRRIIPEIKVWTPKEEKLQRKIKKSKRLTGED